MTSPFRHHLTTQMVSTGVPAVSAEIDRITVFLGANGSGKSKLLRHLAEGNHSGAFTGFMPVYVEGGRVFKDMQAHIAMGPHNAGMFNSPAQNQTDHVNSSLNLLTQRVNTVFTLLEALGKDNALKHSSAVSEWQRNGENGESPRIGESPLQKLFDLFHTIFPNLKLSKHDRIMVENKVCGGQIYQLSEMSEGERQVICLLADLLCVARPNSFFIVDEPELYLHPGLAEKLWSSIEETYPESYFVYATHSFSFAARPQVGCRYILGHGEISEAELWSADSESILRPFWGAAPNISKNRKSLLVEGTLSSFDYKFYSWILGNSDVQIIPVGSCDDVLKACKGAGPWINFNQLAGVVDSDYSDGSSESKNVYKLRFHEAESYLCHPDLIALVTEKLGQKEPISAKKVLAAIVVEAKKTLLSIASKRVEKHLEFAVRPSISKQHLQLVEDIDQLVVCYQKDRTRMLKAAEDDWTEKKIEKLVRQEFLVCQKAINDEDIDKILAYFEGKGLLRLLLRYPGSEDSMSFLSATIKHTEVDIFPHLKELKESLIGLY
ncbi:MAG: hypothetical protein C0473_01460 [Cyanobacteria bacterium DS3.002]|nr:hypothetical protein [Cyanobacteria bacterium DS3.002]MBA4049609.1 hypothetical protein [Cyanobacteria bacterium DS2.008]